jgi:hypothetical protein
VVNNHKLPPEPGSFAALAQRFPELATLLSETRAALCARACWTLQRTRVADRLQLLRLTRDEYAEAIFVILDGPRCLRSCRTCYAPLAATQAAPVVPSYYRAKRKF